MYYPMTKIGKGVPSSLIFQHVPTPAWTYNLQRLSEGAGGLFLPTRPHLVLYLARLKTSQRVRRPKENISMMNVLGC